MVLFIAIPYIINVVAMGYTRQSVAYAFLIFSIYALIKNKNFLFIILIITGSLFHKSLILFSVLYFVNFKFNYKKILILIILSIIVFSLAIYKIDTIQFYIYYYLGEDQHLVSSGTVFRYLINIIACTIIIFLHKF